jgi:hypothetical protein
MMTKEPSEKDRKVSTSFQDAAAVKTPAETERELTDEEIGKVAVGAGK